MTRPDHKARAAVAWGGTPPDWITVLVGCVQDNGLSGAATKIGISAATISLLIANKYPSATAAMQRRVRRALMPQTVLCPVLGAISKAACHGHQQRGVSLRNVTQTRLSIACKSCPNRETAP